MKLLLLFYVTLILKVAQSSSSTLTKSGRVIGGHDATIDNHPYQVALLKTTTRSDRQLFCGGVILNKHHILTAAHCVDGQEIKNIEIRAGHSSYKNSSEVTQILDITKHPHYNGLDYDYDVAVIRLTVPLKLNRKTVWPVTLPAPGQIWNDRTIVSVSGWGNSLTHPFPETLQSINLMLIHGLCEISYGHRFTDRMLCASPENFENWEQDSCQGDSGGPLVVAGPNYLLAGIVSWGQSCALCPYPGVYTNIAHTEIRNFIEKAVH